MSARSYPSRLFAVSALLLAALAAVTSPGPASGRSWLVLLDGSGDAPTIQAAVDSAAAEGDSILVGSGAYYQAVLINNKSLVMRSLEGRDQTTIIGIPGGSTALKLTGSGTKKIVGLALSGTRGADGLGTFELCKFEFSSIGAIVPSGQSGNYTSCLFAQNGKGFSGRGTFVSCEFRGNWGTGGASGGPSSYSDCVFTENTGVGVSATGSTVTNCQISGNHDTGASATGSSFTNCQISGSGGAGVKTSGGTCTFTDCDISDNAGVGLIANGDIPPPTVITRLTNCTVSRNGYYGIEGTGSSGTFPIASVTVECTNTTVSDNSAGGLLGSGYVSFNMIGCEISGNAGPAGSSFVLNLTRCVVWGNAGFMKVTGVWLSSGSLAMTESTYHANGLGIWAEPDITQSVPGRVTINRSIVSGTLAGRGVPQCSSSEYPQLTLSVGCSDIFGNAGGNDVCPEAGSNNFSLDALFCDAAGGDFHLNPSSPCAPGNSPSGCNLIGALPVGCQIVGIDPAASPQLHFGVGQNRPNPFNPSTVIDFTLPVAMPVALCIYDPAGRLVRTLVEGTRAAGHHSAVWDGREASGREAASGIYYYRIEGEGYGVATRKMLLMK